MDWKPRLLEVCSRRTLIAGINLATFGFGYNVIQGNGVLTTWVAAKKPNNATGTEIPLLVW